MIDTEGQPETNRFGLSNERRDVRAPAARAQRGPRGRTRSDTHSPNGKVRPNEVSLGYDIMTRLKRRKRILRYQSIGTPINGIDDSHRSWTLIVHIDGAVW